MLRPRRILLFLLLGAVANVFVAWGAAQCVDGDSGDGDLNQVEFKTLPDEVSDVLYFQERPTAFPTYCLSVERSWCLVRLRYSRMVMSIPDYDSVEYSYVRWGWPFASMQQELAGQWYFAEPIPGWRGGWPLAPDRWPLLRTSINVNRPEHIYPLVPLPLGFTINTLFYAALLFLPFAAFTTLRRRRRISLNLCLSCGYSLAGAVPTNNTIICPECGKPSSCGKPSLSDNPSAAGRPAS